jgi:hypothetical protein
MAIGVSPLTNYRPRASIGGTRHEPRMRLRAFEDLPNRRDDTLPQAPLGRELASARRRQAVRFDAPPHIIQVPFAGNPALAFKAMQRREQRASLDVKDTAGDLADPFGDAHAVQRFEGERAKNQQIERAFEEIGFLTRRLPPRPPPAL